MPLCLMSFLFKMLWLAFSSKLDQVYYSPYKTVWWTLITSCYKGSIDSLTKWLMLYHLWLIVEYSLYLRNFQKTLKLIVHAFRINLGIRHFALYWQSLPLLLRVPVRRLELWFVLWNFFLLRLCFIPINPDFHGILLSYLVLYS